MKPNYEGLVYIPDMYTQICINMHNMHQDAEISISKYARICSTKYAENMHNMHK